MAMSWRAALSRSEETSRRASTPPNTRGCSVLTRPAHDFGKTGVLRYVIHADANGLEVLASSAGTEDLDAGFGQTYGKALEPQLVAYANQRALDFAGRHGRPGDSRCIGTEDRLKPIAPPLATGRPATGGLFAESLGVARALVGRGRRPVGALPLHHGE